mgnify:CR=1 FL=1
MDTFQSAKEALEFLDLQGYPSDNVRTFVQHFLSQADGHSSNIRFEANANRLVWYNDSVVTTTKRIGRVLLTAGVPDTL